MGVQRQYIGTAGRVENSQAAVHLASPLEHAAIDRELYVPRSWTQDTARCRGGPGIPDSAGFTTKPALAARVIGRARAAADPVSWETGDEVYGSNPHLRTTLEEGRSTTYSPSAATTRSPPARARSAPTHWSKNLPKQTWQERSADAKGHRFNDCAPTGIADDRPSATCPSAATDTPTNSPSTAATQPPRRRCPSWCGLQGAGACRGDLPAPQGPDRTGRTPGHNLDVLAPPGHPCNARPCLPRRRSGRRPPAPRSPTG
ncbi:transposase [Streptomyces sp. NPDC002306]